MTSIARLLKTDIDEYPKLASALSEEAAHALGLQAHKLMKSLSLDGPARDRLLVLVQALAVSATRNDPELASKLIDGVRSLARSFPENRPQALRTLLSLVLASPSCSAQSIEKAIQLAEDYAKMDGQLASEKVLADGARRFVERARVTWPSGGSVFSESFASKRTERRSVLRRLDLRTAAKHCAMDAVDDWYKDPWSWLEIRLASCDEGAAIQKSILQRAAVREHGPTLELDVPKGNSSSRPAVILQPQDRILYQSLVDLAVPKLLPDVPDFVYGWRPKRAWQRNGLYAHNGYEWRNFKRRVELLTRTYRYTLKLDIRSFFESIRVVPLLERLAQSCGETVASMISDIVAGISIHTTRRGLPQRCLASSVLAQFELATIDSRLTRFVKSKRGSACRWMDDIFVFSNSETELARMQRELAQMLAAQGLGLNVQKTRLTANPDTPHHNNTYIESTFESDELEAEALFEKSMRQVLSDPEDVPRYMIAFLTKRLRERRDFRLVDKVSELAPAMPHGADHWGRYLRDAGAWRNNWTWFNKECRERRSPADWSPHAWSLMLPHVAPKTEKDLQIFCAESVSRPRGVLTAGLAIRLSESTRVYGDAFREGASLTPNPIEQRSIALTILSAPRRDPLHDEAIGWLERDSYSRALATLIRKDGLKVRPFLGVDYKARSAIVRR